ncbi:hypothetical protein ACFLTJ_02965 [Chloroflexota bacterium]
MDKLSKNMLYPLIVSMIVIVSMAFGCIDTRPSNDVAVTFEQLYSNPNQYNGKEITIEGFIFLGFEIMVLSDELKDSGYAEGHLIPGEKQLWFESGIPTEIYDQLYEQSIMGFSENYGKLRVEGTFRYGQQYGHLGIYDYQISPTEMELLSWSPP